MNSGTATLVLTTSLVCILSHQPGQSEQLPAHGPYLGENPPGMTPAVFAPGVISRAGFHLHSSPAFSPSGKEVCFTKIVFEPSAQGTIWCVSRGEDGWTRPERASFSGVYNDDSSIFSVDGTRLYFTSDRPVDVREDEEPGDLNIWFVEKKSSDWGAPVYARDGLNSDHGDFRLSFARDGTVYLSSDREDPENGTFDVFVAEPGPNDYSKPEKLGDAINTPATEQIACVAADESFLVFFRHDRQKVHETGLYVSFRGEDGTWSTAASLGALFNSPPKAVTQAASLSPDGEYVFFLRRRHEAIYWVEVAALFGSR